MKKIKIEISYKEAMTEIEGIIKRLNEGELDIDMISQDVKRATELVVLCKDKLRRSDEEIKALFEVEQ